MEIKMSDMEMKSPDISQSEGLRRKIDAAKVTLKEKYSVCKTAARRLSGAYARLIDAESKLDLKPTGRLMSRHAIQETQYNVALKEYFSCAELYSSLVEDVITLYEEYYRSESGRAAKKIKAEAAKFESLQYRLKQKIAEGAKDVSEAIGAFDKKTSEKPTDQTARDTHKKADEPAQPASKPQEQQPYQYGAPQQPQYHPQQPMDMYRPYMPHGVNIAPMSIDISGIVQDAVASAMEKFKAAFNKEANAFIDSMPTRIQSPTADSDATRVNSAVQTIAAEEGALAEKLSALMENLKSLSEEMTSLGVAYMQLANTQRDAAELQRRINDMQRAISREIQGVQANQKVINQDQATVSAEQAVVMEQQKANLEGQKLLLESSDGVVDMQKTVIETQGAIEESMRGMLASQKDIITSQQSIINAGTKNAELQHELNERQSELLDMQKSVMSAHKQLVRAQRSFNAKNSIPEKKERKTVSKTELESVADEVESDEIKPDN